MVTQVSKTFESADHKEMSIHKRMNISLNVNDFDVVRIRNIQCCFIYNILLRLMYNQTPILQTIYSLLLSNIIALLLRPHLWYY